jgi:hypothetical protein
MVLKFNKISIRDVNTEQTTVYICIREVLSSNLGTNTSYPEILRTFPQFLQVNSRAVPRLHQDRFLPDPSHSSTFRR